jgi:L-ascorbate metabolism protein UlaG (beta-lactamase superfamily)
MPIKVTWYGHAAFGLELDGYQLLIDPFLTDNPSAAISADQAEADFILISHGHGDHLGDALAIAKRSGAPVISNFEIVNWFADQGIEGHAQHIGGGFHHPFGYLKLTLALHGSALPDGSYGGNPTGFLLTTTDEKKLYFACDTGLFSDMTLIGDEGLDLAAVPIGDNFTMGPDDALKAVKFLHPARVIPIHYDTWDLIAQDANQWADRVRAETEAEPIVLDPGESVTI